MVTNNLQYYGTLLQSGKLLFTVEALLSAPEIVIHPHANELFKLMMQAAREIVEGYVTCTCNNKKCIIHCVFICMLSNLHLLLF